ncbi:MAG: hypothetical protein FWG94_11650, partial [Oscillospiraceae bacterium]|nr:hypothetical protein [Oscillospiraceae bacterium]
MKRAINQSRPAMLRQKLDDGRLPRLFIHLFFGTFCILCALPLLLVISISFTPESFIRTEGYSL